MALQRYTEPQTVSITASASTTEEIPFASYSGGRIHVPTGSSLTSLTFYDAATKEGTFIASYDSAASPAAIVLTVSAAKSYPVPADLFGAASIKIVGNTTGTLTLCLKA